MEDIQSVVIVIEQSITTMEGIHSGVIVTEQSITFMGGGGGVSVRNCCDIIDHD